MKLRVLLFFLFPLYLPAQDLSGIWTGYIETQDNHLTYEVAISENADKITGYSQISYLVDGVENIGIKTVKITKRKNDLLIEDGKLIFDNYSVPSTRTKLIGALLLTYKGSEMVLQGTFRTRSLDMRDRTSYEGNIFLCKKNITESTKLVAKLNEMNLLGGLSFTPENNVSPTIEKAENISLTTTKNIPADPTKIDNKKSANGISTNAIETFNSRQIEILSSLYFASDSLVLSLYDNGTVDGDIVSVFLNNNMIISKGRLSSEAIRVTIPGNVLTNDSLILVMYAENLGAIPPNTGLLIIQDGKERHEIRFAGDMKKSSGVILKRKS